MIKAVFFDLYNTVARFYPPRELVQAQAARAFSLEVAVEGIVRGYVEADELMTAQNARQHVTRLPSEEQRAFFTRYEQLVLLGAGVQASDDLARNVWSRVLATPYGLAAYNDALPCLRSLQTRGLTLAIISNLHGDLEEITRDLGLDGCLDFTVSSREAGAEKPNPRIFHLALQKAGVKPLEAVHVGDQYHGDVVGARSAGIQPVLLDRERLLAHFTGVPCIAGLDEVPRLLDRSGSGGLLPEGEVA